MVLAVNREQPLDFCNDAGSLGGSCAILLRVDEYPALQAIEEQEHVTDVGMRGFTTTGQPLQVGTPCFRGDGVVARPIGCQALGDIHDASRDLQLGIDQRGL
ncbi:hypothetical protein D9M71_607370 [compost metagenome]